MPQAIECKILSNQKLSDTIYEMCVTCEDTSWIKPGNFINIQIPNCYLRRPMAISDFDNNSFNFIYEVVGKGTEKLRELKVGASLNILIRLGNAFTYLPKYGRPLLVSGGAGIGPIFCFAKWLKKQKIDFDWVIGFAKKNKVIKYKESKTINSKVYFCTDDGSFGLKGNVIDIIKKYKLGNLYYYACGPDKMMVAIFKNSKKGQISLDARMGCGFGACVGCTIQTRNGNQRICKDGPIFKSEDLLW